MTAWLLPLLAGFGTGILSAWGVGGGTLLLLIMTLLLGVDHRTAQAVNLLFFLPTAALSLWFHRKKGFIDKEMLQSAAIPGTAAALLCAFLALSVDTELLKKPFGLFLIWAGISMLGKAPKA
jgi:uncharacterized membrane protein YfcA